MDTMTAPTTEITTIDHFNYATGHNYAGANITSLEDWRQSNQWPHAAWLTFMQAKHLGLTIRKGEHGTRVFRGFGEDENGKSHPLGYATVFNISQTDAPDDMAAFDIRTNQLQEA